ncbi:MAG: FtsW/RodA/SpoVE family cell cycle protein [Bacteroidales bacterium]|nr:FtsW/RodA/SpoVE family cell cycle protein [Bacteroidales bacterium]
MLDNSPSISPPAPTATADAQTGLDFSLSAADIPAERALEDKPAHRSDRHIWGIYGFLILISIIELYTASAQEVASSSMGVFGPLLRHGGMLLVGYFIIRFIERVHYSRFVIPILVLALFSVVSMLYVMVAGEIVNGARRSFTIVGVTLQPSEFLKLSAALMSALILSRTQIKRGISEPGVWVTAGVIIAFAALLIQQGLTNTLLLMAISLSMMLIGGMQWSKFIQVLCLYAVFAGIFWVIKEYNEDDAKPSPTEVVATQEVDRSSTWSARLDRYLGDGKPKYEQPITADNRQEMYAYMAQANGGLTGVGPGKSREASRLPLAFSDFIFAIVVEDLGLWGGMFVLLLYLWLLARASSIASRCSRAFPALLVIGMAVMIVYQALFHMAIVTGLGPVSGQPLPLISKGGTSILVTSIAFGVMLSVSRYAVRSGSKRQDIKNEMDSLPEQLRAENPTQL